MNSRRLSVALTVAAAVCLTCCGIALAGDESESSGRISMRVAGGPIKAWGTRIVSTPSGIEIEEATLCAGDGKLEAKADKVLVGKQEPPAAGARWETELSGNISVVLQLKGESKIEATATKGRIDWQNQVIELQENVSVTTYRTISGENVPTTVKGSTARILTMEKLSKGQERVEVVTPAEDEG